MYDDVKQAQFMHKKSLLLHLDVPFSSPALSVLQDVAIHLSIALLIAPTTILEFTMSVFKNQAESSSILSTFLENPFLFLLVPILAVLVSSVNSYFRLSHIPGPFWAKFTNFPRFSWVLTYRAHEIHIALHRQYGPIVRFGPNMVSVGDPKEIGTIYGFKQSWRKVCWRPNLVDDSTWGRGKQKRPQGAVEKKQRTE